MTFSIPILRPTTLDDFQWAANELSRALMIYNAELADPFRLSNLPCELSEDDWILDDDSGDYASMAFDSILFFQPYMLEGWTDKKIPDWPLSRIHDLYQAKLDWDKIEDSPDKPADYDYFSLDNWIEDNEEIPEIIRDWISGHGSS